MLTTNHRTRLIAVMAAAGLALTACGGGDTDADADGLGLIDDDTLVVAMSGEFQPFSYRDGNDLTGFDHDIGAAVAKEMGLEYKTETGAFDTLIGGLKAHRYDVLIASMTPTPERSKQVVFTDGYYTSGAQAFVSEGVECSAPQDLDSPSIGVAAGTTYNEFLAGEDWVGEIRTFSSDITALQDVATGRLDLGMTDRLVGLHQINEAGLPLVQCGDPLYTEEPAFAVNLDQGALKDELNVALAAIKADGTYAEISQKYFGVDISGKADADDEAATTD